MNNNVFAFVLGREQDLALAELQSVLERFDFVFDIYKIAGNVAFAKFESFSDQDAKEVMNQLAGTLKIFRLSNCYPEHGEGSTDNECSVDSSATLQNDILKLILDSKPKTSFNFGISYYSSKSSKATEKSGSFRNLSNNKPAINALGLAIKQDLKGRNIHSRFVALTEDNVLTTIQSLKNNLASPGFELGIFEEGIGRLVALNNPEEWSKFDYDKPAADKYSGMMPPKLAREIINLALPNCHPRGGEAIARGSKIEKSSSVDSRFRGNDKKENGNDKKENGNDKKENGNDKKESDKNKKESRNDQKESGDDIKESGSDQKEIKNQGNENCKLNNGNCILVDPFCGSGNILIEGMRLGLPVIGSDISDKAVKDSLENCRWYNSVYKKGNYYVFQADATSEAFVAKLNTKYDIQNTNNCFAIITEPYLGKPKKFKNSLEATKEEYRPIKKLYLEFLRNVANFYSSHSEVKPLAPSRSSQPYKQDSNNNALEELNNVTVCLVFPLVETSDQGRFSLFQECVDEIEKLGYTQPRNSFTYGRDYQIVKREIVLLKLEQI